MRVALIVAAFAMGGAVVVPFSLAADKPHHHKKKHKHRHKKRPVVTPSPTPSGQRASADVVAGSFHVTFDARRNAGLPPKSATGTFRSEVGDGSTAFLAGPVTCMSVVGNDVGLFYPVTDAFPPLIANTGLSVLVTLKTDGHGNATSLGFVPTTSPITDGCEPGLATMAAEGPATATGGT